MYHKAVYKTCYFVRGTSIQKEALSVIMRNSISLKMNHKGLFSGREIFQLIWPLILDLFLTFFVGMLDSIMVSSVNESAVSAISLIDQIIQLVIMVFSAMAAGGAVIAGQYLGADQKDAARRSAWQLVWLMFLTGAVLCLLLLFFRHAILDLVFGDITDLVYAYSDKYLIITAFSVPMLAVHQAGASVFRTMGNSRTPMLISVMMNVVNFSGNAFLIYKMGMDTDGAGISTLLSRSAAAVVITILLLNPKHLIHYEKTFRYHPDTKLIRKILYVGIPNGLENGMFQLGKILLLSLVSTFGTSAITANAITQNVAQLQLIPAFAVNMAVTTIISRCVGYGDMEQVRYYNRILLFIMYATSLLTAYTIYFSMPLILNLYHASGKTAALTMTMVNWHTFAAVSLWPLSFEIPQALRSSGDVKFTMLTSILIMWCVRITGAYILAFRTGAGAAAPWIAMVIDFVFRTVIYQIRWHSGKWTDKKVI